MKVIFGNQGQRGDLMMDTVAARVFKQQYPGSILVMGINKLYQDVIPLFYQNPYIDSFHIYDQYNDWPNDKDKAYLASAGYDYVFNAMPQHTSPDWYETLHQTQEVCAMHGLPYPQDLKDCQVQLTPWWASYVEPRKDCIAICPVAAAYQGYPNIKSFSREQVAAIIDFAHSHNMKVIQLGGPGEPDFGADENLSGKLSYLESVKTIYGCKAFVTPDSGLNWAMSAFNMPTLGLYGHAYYGSSKVSSIQPINSNAIYLDGPRITDIGVGYIIAELERFVS